MSKIKLGGDTFGVTFHLWTTTSYSQSKSPHSCKTPPNRGIYWVLLNHLIGNLVRHILISLSFLLLSSPVIGQETGVLFLREVNDNWGWFEDGNKDKDAKYIGEFKDGFFEDRQPNGQGTITYPNGNKYVGEWKDGFPNGQGT